MSIDAAVHFDGDFSTPVQNGPWVAFVDNDAQCTLYKAEFQQISLNFERLDFGTVGPSELGSVTLVEESEGSSPGGPLVKWTRTYAPIPPSRSVPEGFVYSYQLAIPGTPPNILEFPLFVTSTSQYDYFLASDPTTIPLFKTYRLSLVDNVPYGVGTPPTVGATRLVGENSKLTRWKGNIWERLTRYVPIFGATVAG